MANTGTLELYFSQNGQPFYTITLTYNDIVGTLYPVNGTPLTIEEVQGQGIILQNRGMLPNSGIVKRSISFERIPRSILQTFLYDRTGGTQIRAIKRLDKLFEHGIPNLKTQFTWER